VFIVLWFKLLKLLICACFNCVGVSNYGVDALRACHGKLSKRGIKLATNQIQMSLLYRWPIENGLLDVCKELDVKVSTVLVDNVVRHL
jgi:predicted oxidoreductase